MSENWIAETIIQLGVSGLSLYALIRIVVKLIDQQIDNSKRAGDIYNHYQNELNQMHVHLQNSGNTIQNFQKMLSEVTEAVKSIGSELVELRKSLNTSHVQSHEKLDIIIAKVIPQKTEEIMKE